MNVRTFENVPSGFYGVLQQSKIDTPLDEAIEQVRALGYAVIDVEYTEEERKHIANAFDIVREGYIRHHGAALLREIDEYNNIRLLVSHGGGIFLRLATNPMLLRAVQQLIAGKFVLNQQNGVVNPPKERYNQGAWHRDLPYQHFVSSTPLAVNALYCIDDFTRENGATFVLPASHKLAALASPEYIRKNAVQIEARAGQIILLDAMVFHSGGFNGSDHERRAINHVFNIPYFKQQIRIPGNLDVAGLSPFELEILGFKFQEPASVADFLAERKR
ncbi:Phytanoyl-CoA dioxygenase (PhyH) [Variovorax sp. SRS16]|uniref:phytanoyl-CoA dioxygenase family protein n=1 Tax=Variovorax sp. SRS16 TaxID=282217 RepID=UPI00131782D2|nr:phytanoyl-CoA dioxygenase family protein [Variovorax sp. SRS16]VTU13705.1 Phytanoyl-CoA dioxygenase (PhyH) [Variovorax sp. SRS16]